MMVEKNTKKNLHKTNIFPVSWAVFLFTLAVVLISLVSVVFPSLIVSSAASSSIPKIGTPDPFEGGLFAAPVIATSIIVFALAFLYFTNRLPLQITNAINFVLSFEVSKKVAIISVVSILVIYVAASAPELMNEDKWPDYRGVKKKVENWTIGDFGKTVDAHVNYLMLNISMSLFGNYNVVPFIGSIILVVATFFVTKQIAKKRFAGIVSMIIILQSQVFLLYDTSATYTNFWILLYLFSLYLMSKKWAVISVVPYVISIFAKALNALFLPMSIFYAYRAEISKKNKTYTVLAYAIIVAIGIIASYTMNVNIAGTPIELTSLGFWQGFTSMAFQMRFDGLIIVFLLPLIVGLFIASRKGIKQADSIMVLIAGILFSAPLLTGFTDQTNQPYRFLPLVVFFAMGVGVLLTKRTTPEQT